MLTGKPWNEPGGDVRGADPDHLLVPVAPRRRRGPRTPRPSRSCRRATTRAMPSAPANSSGRSDERHVRDRQRREPLRQGAHHATPRAPPRSNTADGERSTATTATRTAGILGSDALQHEDQDQARRRRPPPPLATVSPSATPSHEPRRPRRGTHRHRPRTRTASGAGPPGSSAPGRSCSRSASAWRAGRR